MKITLIKFLKNIFEYNFNIAGKLYVSVYRNMPIHKAYSKDSRNVYQAVCPHVYQRDIFIMLINRSITLLLA